jgi:hypothetical protein
MKYATPLTYGFLGGMIMILLLTLAYIMNVKLLVSYGFMTCLYLPLIFLMIWGGIQFRKEVTKRKEIVPEENVLGFPFILALKGVFIISVVATTMYDGFGFFLFSVIDPELVTFMKAQTIDTTREMMERFNTPEDKMKTALAQIENTDYTPSLKSLLTRQAWSMAIGLLFSLIISAFVARSRETTSTDSQ